MAPLFFPSLHYLPLIRNRSDISLHGYSPEPLSNVHAYVLLRMASSLHPPTFFFLFFFSLKGNEQVIYPTGSSCPVPRSCWCTQPLHQWTGLKSSDKYGSSEFTNIIKPLGSTSMKYKEEIWCFPRCFYFPSNCLQTNIKYKAIKV